MYHKCHLDIKGCRTEKLYLSAAFYDLNFLAANNRNRTGAGAKLRSCLNQGIRSCGRRAVCSDENNNLLTGVAAMGNAFISFHIVPPNLLIFI